MFGFTCIPHFLYLCDQELSSKDFVMLDDLNGNLDVLLFFLESWPLLALCCFLNTFDNPFNFRNKR